MRKRFAPTYDNAALPILVRFHPSHAADRTHGTWDYGWLAVVKIRQTMFPFAYIYIDSI